MSAGSHQHAPDNTRRETNVLRAFWGTLAAGTLALLAFSLSAAEQIAPMRQFALGLLVGGAAALVGALLGFLFGLPRTADEGVTSTTPASGANESNDSEEHAATPARSPSVRRPARANNNLLEISDWLTKIIVGAGLVGLKDLAGWVAGVSQLVGEGAGLIGAEAQAFGGAVVTFFFGWGFLFVYIQTRTIISVIFVATERTLEDVLRNAVAGQVEQAVAAEVRDQVVPELAKISVGTIMQLLYTSPREAEKLARTFLSREENAGNGLVWLYLACALGQQHANAAAEQQRQLRDAALDALKQALRLDPDLKALARGFAYTDDENHLEGDSDLASFREDEAFHQLLGPPPRTEVK